MANHPSAEKRNRQRVVRAVRNKAIATSVKSALKQARAAIAGDPKTAQATVQKTIQALARAASRGVIHPKAASRKTARLAAQLHRAAK